MDVIFEVTDKTGRKIRLTKERWAHILKYHPYLSNSLEEIKEALIKPLIIVPSKDDENKYHYYRPLKDISGYLLVSVKYLNNEGFIPTAFWTSKIKKR
ncbi:hypothetical protein HYV49_04840 [Candidatus Pacearchaeota archaeon]|nr:hypothetical protein [Candidatus Pacearchaeota archaeon]